MKDKITSFLNNTVRVLRLSKKPSKEEFFTVAKITGLGIVVLGLIGYAITSLRFILG